MTEVWMHKETGELITVTYWPSEYVPYLIYYEDPKLSVFFGVDLSLSIMQFEYIGEL